MTLFSYYFWKQNAWYRHGWNEWHVFTICSKITLTNINSMKYFYHSFFGVFSVSVHTGMCLTDKSVGDLIKKPHFLWENWDLPKKSLIPAMFAIFANITYFPFGWTVLKCDILFPSSSIKKIRRTHLSVSVQLMVQKNVQQLWMLAFKFYDNINSTWTETSATYALLMLQKFMWFLFTDILASKAESPLW